MTYDQSFAIIKHLWDTHHTDILDPKRLWLQNIEGYEINLSLFPDGHAICDYDEEVVEGPTLVSCLEEVYDNLDRDMTDAYPAHLKRTIGNCIDLLTSTRANKMRDQLQYMRQTLRGDPSLYSVAYEHAAEVIRTGHEMLWHGEYVRFPLDSYVECRKLLLHKAVTQNRAKDAITHAQALLACLALDPNVLSDEDLDTVFKYLPDVSLFKRLLRWKKNAR